LPEAYSNFAVASRVAGKRKDATMSELLRLDSVSLHYGSLRAVDEVSLDIGPGDRHALIGPNGAGKSSLLGLIAGTLRCTSGRVLVDTEDLTRMPEHARARRGVVKTFQHSSVFLGLTVLDNVELAVQRVQGFSRRAFRPLARIDSVWRSAWGSLVEVDLAHRAHDLANTLSHGERRQLEVALTLALRPKLLLLDEPTAGMSSAESAAFVRLVKSLPRTVTVLLIEHDLDTVFNLAETISVLHAGRLIASGDAAAIRGSQAVQDAYLGGAHFDALFEDDEA
jgi:branched-chain amino acid transport system ATP-binding protein